MVNRLWPVPPLLLMLAAVVMLVLVSGASATMTSAKMAGKGTGPKCTRQEIMSCVFPVWKTLKTKYDLLRSTSRLEFTESDFGNVCTTLLARIYPCMRKFDQACDGYTLHALRSLNNTFKYMCNLGWGEFQEFRTCYANTTDPTVPNKVRQCYHKSGLAHRDFFDSEKDMYHAYQTDWWYRNRRDDFYQEHVQQDHLKSRQPSPNKDNNNNNHEDSDYGHRQQPEERGYQGHYTNPYFQHAAFRPHPFGYHPQFDEFGHYGIHPEDVYTHRDPYHRNYFYGHVHQFPYGYLPYGPYFPPYGQFYHHPYPWNHPAFLITYHQPRYDNHASPWTKKNEGRGYTDPGNQEDDEEQVDDDKGSHANNGYVRLRNYNYDTCKGFEMMLHCVNEFKNHCSKEEIITTRNSSSDSSRPLDEQEAVPVWFGKHTISSTIIGKS